MYRSAALFQSQIATLSQTIEHVRAMSGYTKDSTSPVTAEELNQVRSILERMNAQGLTPGASATSALASFESQPVTAAMTDASKRLRADSEKCRQLFGTTPSEAEISQSMTLIW